MNLTDLQKTLDAQGIELVENQKESVVGRKALADRTKGSFPSRFRSPPCPYNDLNNEHVA